MKRRNLLVAALSLALAAGSLTPLAAAPKPQIEDPLNDANFINDQGSGDGTFGNFAGPADGGSVSDLLAVTLSNDKKNLYIQVDTEAAPPAISGVGFRVRTNPDDAGTHCLEFEAYFPGANNTLTAAKGVFEDVCAGAEPVDIEVLGTQMVIPRSAHKAFAKGGKLTSPQAQSFLFTGDGESVNGIGPYVDTTTVGKDFKFKK